MLLTVRRIVADPEAVYSGEITVEDMPAVKKINSVEE